LADNLAAGTCGLLTIDVAAIVKNYKRLLSIHARNAVAPVVKADAYGLGAARVAPALAKAGAREFFVAQLSEAVALRQILNSTATGCTIYVLNGLQSGAEKEFLAHDLRPMLNALDEASLWKNLSEAEGRPLAAALHVDTGMCRLGLPAKELDSLAGDHSLLDGIEIALLMSHLACADEPDHPLNEEQRQRFETARRRLPPFRTSFANSSGVFLDRSYHFDLARPGVALYGANPTPGKPNPMCQVIRLQGKILQVRDIDAGQSVGYGATHKVKGPTRIATVGAGYADGYLRALSNRASAWIDKRKAPVVGRVSMDLITVDVSDFPESATRPGTLVDLLPPDEGVDGLASAAGTIGYEILTSLGRRYHRTYLGETSASC